MIGASLKEDQESVASLHWLGLDTRYFVLAVVPSRDATADLGVQVAHDTVAGQPAVRGSVAASTSIVVEVEVEVDVVGAAVVEVATTAVDVVVGAVVVTPTGAAKATGLNVSLE